MSGLDLIRALHLEKIETQAVMVTAHATVASAVSAMRHGAFDYIEKPFDVDQLEQLVARAIRHGAAGGRRSSVPAVDGHALAAMIGSSAATAALRQRIAQVAPTDVTVLITGESGSGKEVVARAIHAASRRSAGAMVSLNCPALSPQLMESELFGHERGAFTGAVRQTQGLFEAAHGGTLLLDEISETSPTMQAKLLRVLQEREIRRVGSSRTVAVDARIVATTNRDLAREVQAGRFRTDLFHRLNVVRIEVPALRERTGDLAPLTDTLVRRKAEEHDLPCPVIDPAALAALSAYPWPGNVRQLENTLERALLLCRDGILRTTDLALDAAFERPSSGGGASFVGTTVRDAERALILDTLRALRGNRTQAARVLGISVRTMRNKLHEYRALGVDLGEGIE